VILFADQSPGPLMVDIINAFAEEKNHIKLFAGEVIEANSRLNPGVTVLSSFKYKRETPGKRISTWLLFSVNLFFYLLFSTNLKAIIAVTNPPFAPFVANWMARFKRIPFYLIVYDLYPDALAQVGILRSDNWLFKFWSRQNTIIFSRAEKIFAISETMKKAIAAYISPTKICVIHNWADTDYLKPVSKSFNPFISKNGFEGKRIILYSGNMGLTHDLESVVHAAQILKNQPDIIFVLIGEGAKKAKLRQLVTELEISNVVFLPYQDVSMFPFAMASANIGIVTLGNGAEGISVPSKTYTNMAAGLCIIAVANESSELGSIIREHQVGTLCEPNNPVLLASTIDGLLNNSDQLNNFRSNSLKAAQNYSKKNAKIYLKEFLASERNQKMGKI
jgi:glycosyltransferase involved in cell wall biosynthesis